MIKKRPKLELMIIKDVYLDEIISNIVDLPDRTIIKFVADLDLACQDWAITEALQKHFTKEMKKFDGLSEEDKKLIESC